MPSNVTVTFNFNYRIGSKLVKQFESKLKTLKPDLKITGSDLKNTGDKFHNVIKQIVAQMNIFVQDIRSIEDSSIQGWYQNDYIWSVIRFFTNRVSLGEIN
jgi:hypothetical protein